MRRAPVAAPRSNAGIALVSGLLLLLVVTILALSMLRSVGLLEKIAGNTREKQRAFQAAQGALQFGEWWLGQGHWGVGAACTAPGSGVLTQATVCSNLLADPASLPWSARVEYQPSQMTVAAGGGQTTSGDLNYSARPAFHIGYLGLSPDGMAMLYRINAVAYGGNTSTVAVVQSVFAFTAQDAKDLTAP